MKNRFVVIPVVPSNHYPWNPGNVDYNPFGQDCPENNRGHQVHFCRTLADAERVATALANQYPGREFYYAELTTGLATQVGPVAHISLSEGAKLPKAAV